MARVDDVTNSLISGELTPKMYGRADLELFYRGARRIENGLVGPHGGVYTRTGTRHVDRLNDTERVRLDPFIFSEQQSLIIAHTGDDIAPGADEDPNFTDNTTKFYADDTTTGITAASPYTPAEAWQTDYAQDLDFMWYVHPTAGNHRLIRVTPTEFIWHSLTVNPIDSETTPYPRTAQIYTNGPYLPIGFYGGQWEDAGNANVDPTPGARRIRQRPSGGDNNAPGAFGSGTVGDPYSNIPLPSEGRLLRLDNGTNQGTYTILGLDDTSTVGGNNNVWQNFAALLVDGTNIGNFTEDVRFGAFTTTTGANAIAIHEGRLWLGGSSELPNRIWGSVSDDFLNFDDTTDDADKAIVLSVGAGQVNEIRWMTSTNRRLMIGTDGAEFSIEAKQDSTLTPTSAAVLPATNRGGRAVKPAVIDNRTYFVGKSGRQIRSFSYNFESDALTAPDASILAEHLFSLFGEVTQMAYKQDPDSQLFMTTTDGRVITATIEHEQSVRAYSRQRLAGEEAKVLSVASIPSEDGLEDRLWLQVSRRNANTSVLEFDIEVGSPAFVPELPLRAPYITRHTALEEKTFTLDAAHEYADERMNIYEITDLRTSGFPGRARLTIDAPTLPAFASGTCRLGGVLGCTSTDFPDGINFQIFPVLSLAAVDPATGRQDLDIQYADPSITTMLSEYLGGGIAYNPVENLTGLENLSGYPCTVFADGVVVGENVNIDPSGFYQLPAPAGRAVIGIPYETVIEPNMFVNNTSLGSGLGKPSRMAGVDVEYIWSGPFEVNSGDLNPDLWQEVPQEKEAASSGGLPDNETLVSGFEYVATDSDIGDSTTVVFRQTEPYPVHILAMTPRLEQNAP